MQINCYSCPACQHAGERICDRDNFSICRDSAYAHAELGDLVWHFPKKVDDALFSINDSQRRIDEELRRNDINVTWTYNLEEYLENIKKKKSEIQDEYKFNFNKDDLEKEYETKYEKLKNRIEKENKKIDNDFIKRKEELENDLQNKIKQHKFIMAEKENIKNNLINQLNQLKGNNTDNNIKQNIVEENTNYQNEKNIRI